MTFVECPSISCTSTAGAPFTSAVCANPSRLMPKMPHVNSPSRMNTPSFASEKCWLSTFNSSALTLAAFMYLIVTLPMARLVDWLIHRQQKRTQRGPASGGGDDDGQRQAEILAAGCLPFVHNSGGPVEIVGDSRMTFDDVADAVAWLCSPGSEMVRGHTLVVDGGFSLLAQ